MKTLSLAKQKRVQSETEVRFGYIQKRGFDWFIKKPMKTLSLAKQKRVQSETEVRFVYIQKHFLFYNLLKQYT
jgi:hypothetical protein